jgi:hypothetical protein
VCGSSAETVSARPSARPRVGGATIRKASHRREPFGCHCRPGTHWNWRSLRPTSGRIPCRKDQEGSTDPGGFRRASGQTGVF